MTKKFIFFLWVLYFMGGDHTPLFPYNAGNSDHRVAKKTQKKETQKVKDNKEKQRIERIGQVLRYGSSEQVRKVLSSLSRFKTKCPKKIHP